MDCLRLRLTICFICSPMFASTFFFFFQAEDGIRDLYVTGGSDVCSSDLVVPPVQPPGPAHRNPVTIRGGQGEIGRPDRPPLQGGVREGGQDPVLGQQRPGADGFLLARGGQVGVLPAGEDPGGVPFALPVAQQDQATLPHHDSSSAARPGRVLPWMYSRLAPPPVET